MAYSFRRIYKFLMPAWLWGGEGEKAVYSLAVMKDAMLTHARLALEARFPSRAGASSLALIGADRGIQRGRSETQDHYAGRLRSWRYPRGHRVRGNAFAFLEQLSEYWGGTTHVYTVDAQGTIDDRAANGTETTTFDTAWDWDGADPEVEWGRFWTVMYATGLGITASPAWGDPTLWGGAYNLPGYSIGFVGLTSEDAAAMRQLTQAPREWKPAGVRSEWLIVSLDGSTPAPDGTWGKWGKDVAGVRVAARDQDFRYISLTPEANLMYGGDPTLWVDEFAEVGGGTYAPGATTEHATIPLIQGGAYTPNPTVWHDKIRLFDDGDAPRAIE